jgi:hypothetical protein
LLTSINFSKKEKPEIRGSVIRVENFKIERHFEDGAFTLKHKMGYKVKSLLGTKFKVTRERFA